jgi:hypothetical protein
LSIHQTLNEPTTKEEEPEEDTNDCKRIKSAPKEKHIINHILIW